MDWPLAGAVAGVLVLAGAVTAGTVVALRATPEPPKKPQTFVLLLAPPPDTPGYTQTSLSTNDDDEATAEARLQRPSDPITPPAPKKSAHPEATAKVSPTPGHNAKPAPAPGAGADAAKQPLQVAPERWRVVTTAKASFFNLGGHVDKAGVVDSMASEHLREAFKKHRNFPKLPPDIKAHINTSSTIDLVKLAPYRKLLGVDDRWLEQEQGVRFERIAGNR